MKLFHYEVSWRYASENFLLGVVWANSKEDALDKLKKHPAYANCINYDVYGEITPDQGIIEIYQH